MSGGRGLRRGAVSAKVTSIGLTKLLRTSRSAGQAGCAAGGRVQPLPPECAESKWGHGVGGPGGTLRVPFSSEVPSRGADEPPSPHPQADCIWLAAGP